MVRTSRARVRSAVTSISPATSGERVAAEIHALTEQSLVTGTRVAHWASLIPEDDIFMIAHTMSYDAPAHTHDYYELSFIMNGMVMNVIDQRRLYMSDNTLCVMNLNTRHALEIVDPDAVVLNIGLRPQLFEEGIFHDFLVADNFFSEFLRGESGYDYLIFPDTDDDSLAITINGLVETYVAKGQRPSFALAGQLLLFLDRLSETRRYTHAGIDDKTAAIMRYIDEHVATVSVSSIARAFGYNANYCSQYIRAHTGFTATELIEETRLNHAETMLSETDLSIEIIAHQVGYRSPSRFYEVFRKRHGMTPTDFRLLSRELRPLSEEESEQADRL